MQDVQTAHSTAARVLVFAPVGRDGELTRAFLGRASVPVAVCDTLDDLCGSLEAHGAGALLLTEEALEARAFPRLSEIVARQPSWSDLPVLLFAGGRAPELHLRQRRALESLQNVTLLERPARAAAVISAVRAALRSRTRQYEVRDLLEALGHAREEAEHANRLKDEFLATLSHELRTPLNAIVSWTSMLVRGQVEAERLPRVYQVLDRNAQAQAQLIADVLDVSRIITGKLQLTQASVDVGKLVSHAAETLRPAAAAKGVQLATEEASGCLVSGDAGRLQQVIWNLLSNAIKFTPEGGMVEASVTAAGSQVAITVRDNGVGISPEFLPHVFDRFRQADQTTTRAQGGLGLGLSIAKRLIELHGGSVEASSGGIARGAVFRVVLPRLTHAPPPGTGTPPEGQSPAVTLSGRSALVVDDDASTREVVAAVLEQAGATVVSAASADQGWTALLRVRPHVLVTDLAMPGEDGYAFVRRVRRELAGGQGLPVVALSAFADVSSEAAARAAGCSRFVAKPARAETLLEAVHEALSEAPQLPEHLPSQPSGD